MTTLDLDATYTARGFEGVALRVVGLATEDHEVVVWLCDHDDDSHDDECEYIVEVETIERDDMVRAVMVGDDTEHLIDTSDLTPLDREDYCGGCGQVGCGWG